MTTPTTLRDREPGTEDEQALARMRADVEAERYRAYRAEDVEALFRILDAAREQAATEASRSAQRLISGDQP